MTDDPKPRRQATGKPFVKGQSGNPSGRPIGARHKATLAAEALLDGQAEGLTQKAIEKALEGDTTALRLCLERLVPPRRDRPVVFDAGMVATPADALATLGRVIEAMAAGQLTPGEAVAVTAVLDGFRRAYETTNLEARIAALEGPT